MEKDIKREALRQYFKYFKIWFIIAGILAVITIGAAVVHALTPKPVRGNGQEPTERVYDYADMLTEEVDFSEDVAKTVLLEDEIQILVSIGDGPVSATAWGCDLTYDYVKINGDYRS